MEQAALSLGASQRGRSSAGSSCRTSCRRSVSGAALAFARAVGEFGSVVLISGNIPFQTQVSSVYVFKQIESDNPISAAAVVGRSCCAISLVVLHRRSAASGAGGRAMTLTAAGDRAARRRAGLAPAAAARAGRARLLPDVRARGRRRHRLGHDARRGVGVLADDRGDGDRGAAQRDRSGCSWRSRSRAGASAARRCSTRCSTCRSRSRRSSSACRSSCSTDAPAGSARGSPTHGIQVIFSVRASSWPRSSCRSRSSRARSTPVLREIGDEQEQAAATLGAGGWTTFRRITFPAIRWGVAYGIVLSVARAIGEFGAVSVVSGKRRRRDRDADAARRAALRELRPRGRLRGVRAAGA